MSIVFDLFCVKSISRAVLVVVPMSLALIASRAASQTTESQSRQEQFERSYSVKSGSTLIVENMKGTIHVTGSDSDRILVKVYKKFSGSDADKKRWMDETKVNFQDDSEHLRIRVEYPSRDCTADNVDSCDGNGKFQAEVQLTIEVPRQTNVELSGHKPNMAISSIQGDIRITSHKSPIKIQSTTGAIHVNTNKETVNLIDVTIRGALDLKTVKGDAMIKAKSLGNEVNLETEKGKIVLHMPSNVGADVDFAGGRGSAFHSDLPIAEAGSSDTIVHTVRGTINRGGTRMRLRTEKGSIALENL
jgi:putative adhesin